MYVFVILESIILPLISGLLLTVIIFLIKEKISPLPNLFGHWIFTITYKKTKYNTYESMKLEYKVLLNQKNKELSGTGEKISEKEEGKKIKKYIGKHRVRIELDGYIHKNYLSKDSITLHIKEYGERRESSTIYKLNYKRGELLGCFISTIADSSGKVIAHREQKVC